MRPAPLLLALPLLAAPLLLAACAKPAAAPVSDLDALDNQLADGALVDGPDPASAAAVRGPLLTDPGLTAQANARAVRPAPRPDPGAMPPDDLGAPTDTSRVADLAPTPAAAAGCPQCGARRGAITLGALAERQPAKPVAACAAGIGYATIWSTRLPAALPLYPDARVAEAAGSDANGCALRVVSFASAAPLARVADWYTGHAQHAGLRPQHRADRAEHVLAADGGALSFTLYLRPRAGGGTEADLVTSGR